MIRDGYTCVVTGFQDPSHPALDPNIPEFDLQGAHILRRAIAKFDNDRGSDSVFNSAVTTFDILVNYTRLPLKTLEELHDHLDDPSNGMMLVTDAHNGFDRFYWCLKKTETDNVYALKIFRKRGLYRTHEFVTFKDRSGEFSSSRKRKRPISLPNPHYIAIHAAIAEVLHMSGAGKFFDELLDRYKDDEGNVPPVQSWPELEKLMLEGLLKESLESMHLVTAH